MGCLRVVPLVMAAALWVPGEARAEDGGPGEGLFREGYALYGKGEFHEAIRVLEQAAGVAESSELRGKVHGYLGVVYHVVNQPQKAEAAFRRALRFDPTFRLRNDEVGGKIAALFEEVHRKLTGKLHVRSRQKGVRVLLDGKEVGRTPWSRPLPVGRYTVGLETEDRQQGCYKEVLIQAGTRVAVRCQPERLAGRLSLVTTPPDARVTLGGKLLGTTPLQEVPIPVGEHDLKILLLGYKEQSLRVEVKRDRPAAVAISLERILVEVPKGKLLVRTTPAQARVYVDGKLAGESPLAVPVAAGERKVTLRHPGHEPQDRLVRVDPGGTVELEVSLARVAPAAAKPGPAAAAGRDREKRRPPAGSGGPRRRGRVWTWVVACTAAGVAVAGAVMGG